MTTKKPLKRLPKKIAVEVTASDIANGVRGCCTQCPIARAVKRAGLPNPDISIGGIWLGSGTWYDMPAKCTTFYQAFDRDMPVKPFKFTATRVDR